MKHPVRLLLALFSFALTVHKVRCGDAFAAALNSSCATYWLVTWIEED